MPVPKEGNSAERKEHLTAVQVLVAGDVVSVSVLVSGLSLFCLSLCVSLCLSSAWCTRVASIARHGVIHHQTALLHHRICPTFTPPFFLVALGAISGGIAKTVTAPIDRVKILYQVSRRTIVCSLKERKRTLKDSCFKQNTPPQKSIAG